VVGGEARGRRLTAPPGRGTRPTGDRVREAIFDMLGSLDAVAGAQVADLFAGSGALGIEALSRGAASVTFVESDRRAAEVIRGNLVGTGLHGSRVRIVVADVLGLAATPDPGPGQFDLVLADPPYAFDGWPALLGQLRAGWLAPAGLLAIELGAEIDLGPGWEVLRLRHYGGTVVILACPERTVLDPNSS
jgi:16S rRNA (guanine966-N2)-methyltransferase